MRKLFAGFMTVSILLSSATSFAGVCKTPVKIDIYDRASRNAANLLKVKLNTQAISQVKIENIVVDEYGRNRARLPYVHSKPVVHARANLDKSCVDIAVKSLISMGFNVADIAYRTYAYGSELEMVKVSIPPRTFLYDQDGTLTIKNHSN